MVLFSVKKRRGGVEAFHVVEWKGLVTLHAKVPLVPQEATWVCTCDERGSSSAFVRPPHNLSAITEEAKGARQQGSPIAPDEVNSKGKLPACSRSRRRA